MRTAAVILVSSSMLPALTHGVRTSSKDLDETESNSTGRWLDWSNLKELNELGRDRYERPNYVREKLKCYCKEVENESECPDNKHPDEPSRPDGPRFFHSFYDLGDSWPGDSRCCKLEHDNFATTVGFGVGRGYTTKQTYGLCEGERRDVPPTACCRMTDSHGSMGFRVKSSWTFGKWDRKSKTFGKAEAFVKPLFITGAYDADGGLLDKEQTNKLVEKALRKGRFGGNFVSMKCDSTLADLISTTVSDADCSKSTGVPVTLHEAHEAWLAQ
eukprot:TRINITY_DN594_c0_g1_i1.p1 TRINITY_DN594_c0_g1~~TRINITY_DN594_c0_g1_i1.p1  ORF type:complete len:272 (+),score=27.47 TRINITY_DN594_c0_g1_i1:103-918(+)